MSNIAESLNKAAPVLLSAEIADPRREATSLLCFALGKDRTFLIAHPEYELNRDEAELFGSIVKRRANREPFHHITGVKEFYGLDFIVSPDVLIPRPETEMLVAKSINILSLIDKPVFCEIGVGSGCIAISILRHVLPATAVGLDISEAAVAIASRNATNHDIQERLRLVNSDIFGGLKHQSFDLIVSNPPYIPVEDIASLQPEVKDFEPHLALTDGAGGLSVIEKIIIESPRFLKSGCPLVMEIGIGQAGAVRAMFDPDLWRSIEIFPDFQAIPRLVCAVLA
ncbi:MAG: peptide chain release factor N(5)-glutamine methyltransferase [Pyrinomonadaceae bacterium]